MEVWIKLGQRSNMMAFGFVRERRPSGPPLNKLIVKKGNKHKVKRQYQIFHNRWTWFLQRVNPDYKSNVRPLNVKKRGIWQTSSADKIEQWNTSFQSVEACLHRILQSHWLKPCHTPAVSQLWCIDLGLDQRHSRQVRILCHSRFRSPLQPPHRASRQRRARILHQRNVNNWINVM